MHASIYYIGSGQQQSNSRQRFVVTQAFQDGQKVHQQVMKVTNWQQQGQNWLLGRLAAVVAADVAVSCATCTLSSFASAPGLFVIVTLNMA
jgi:hypothetical protein